ncbi:MAG: M15 family metallopeptidase, partial [Pseudomonadota bacterium]
GLYLRKSVAEKIVSINQRLETMGLELYLFDAWRPQAIQRHFHDVWFPSYLRERHPEWSDEEIAVEVEKYWAAPSDGEASPAPHATGGATDLTLRVKTTGQPLFMGGLFDDLTDNAHTDRFERPPTSMSDEEAQANRRILYWVMLEAGFANNPTEWWHYSYGDQMWARLYDQPAALYGACDPTET